MPADDLTAIKIYKEIKELVLKSYALGLHLGIPKYMVDIISSDYQGDAEQRMINILDTWLKVDLKASWQKLQATIRDDMGYKAIADQLQPKVDKEILNSKEERIDERKEASIAAAHDLEDKMKELDQDKDEDELPDDLNEHNVDEIASRLQTSVEKTHSDCQSLEQMQQENEQMYQEAVQEREETERIWHRIEDRAQNLTSEKERNIIKGFDVILQQLDCITDDMDIKGGSSTAKHQQRMEELDTMTDKLSATDHQLYDCKKVLKLVDTRLEVYNHEIDFLVRNQEMCSNVLREARLKFDHRINMLKRFNTKVNSWRDGVNKQRQDLETEKGEIETALGLRRSIGLDMGLALTSAIFSPVNAIAGSFTYFGHHSPRHQRLTRMAEIEPQLAAYNNITEKCTQVSKQCTDIIRKYT